MPEVPDGRSRGSPRSGTDGEVEEKRVEGGVRL